MEILAAATAIIGVVTFLAGILVILINGRRRSEVIGLFEKANTELRAQVEDSREKIAGLEKQNAEQAGEIRVLQSLVTQRAAVDELSGYLADTRRTASDEHRQMIDHLKQIALLLGERRAA